MFFRDYFFCLWVQSVEDDLLTSMADETDISVALAWLEIAFFGECYD